MNHRDTTIVMFFLMGGLILSVIVLIILCCILFVRVRNDTPEHRHHRHENKFTHIEKQMKFNNIE